MIIPTVTLWNSFRKKPYYQYFIGLPGYQMEVPFVPSLLVEFRKRLTEEILTEINEMILRGEYRDNTDRIEVERTFSLAKGSYGLGWICIKLE